MVFFDTDFVVFLLLQINLHLLLDLSQADLVIRPLHRLDAINVKRGGTDNMKHRISVHIFRDHASGLSTAAPAAVGKLDISQVDKSKEKGGRNNLP